MFLLFLSVFSVLCFFSYVSFGLRLLYAHFLVIVISLPCFRCVVSSLRYGFSPLFPFRPLYLASSFFIFVCFRSFFCLFLSVALLSSAGLGDDHLARLVLRGDGHVDLVRRAGRGAQVGQVAHGGDGEDAGRGGHRPPLGTALGPTCGLWDKYANAAAGHGFQAGPENFGYLAATVCADTGEKAKETGREAKAKTEEAAEEAKDKGDSYYQQAKDTLKSGAEKTKETGENAWEGIKSGAEKTKETGEGAWEGIKSGAEKTGDTLKKPFESASHQAQDKGDL